MLLSLATEQNYGLQLNNKVSICKTKHTKFLRARHMEAFSISFGFPSTDQLTTGTLIQMQPTIDASGEIVDSDDVSLRVTVSTVEGPIPDLIDGDSGYQTGSTISI